MGIDRYINVNNHKVHYVEYGTGIPVFSIHGYEIDHRMMSGALEPVFKNHSGYRRIYVDVPGFGKTPGDNMKNTDEWVSLLNGVIDQLIGTEEPFLLAGQSYGCYLMLNLLLIRPEQIKGTLFIAPCTIAERAPRRLPVKALVDVDHELVSRMPHEDFDQMVRWSCVISEEAYEAFLKDLKPGLELEDKPYTRWIEKNGYRSINQDKFTSVSHSMPSLWITARQDFYVGYKDPFDLSENFERATFVCLDGAGHNMHIEKQKIFNGLVEDWLYRTEHMQPFEYDPDFVPYPE